MLVAPKAQAISWKELINLAQDKLRTTEKKLIIDNHVDSGDQAKTERVETKNKKDVPDNDYSINEIEEAADYASNATGVNKDFLMGMLTVETALGQNTGQCTYGEVEEGAKAAHDKGQLGEQAWDTFLSRKKVIQNLASELNYNYEKLRVSCNPPQNVYAGTGGAMGVAQFMPDTWMEYKDRITDIGGSDHPDPWNVRDAVVAMALKLSDVPGVTQHDVYAEIDAAKIYLSGTTSARYNWYANEVQYWAKNYQKMKA